jgi:hypothetical protein
MVLPRFHWKPCRKPSLLKSWPDLKRPALVIAVCSCSSLIPDFLLPYLRWFGPQEFLEVASEMIFHHATDRYGRTCYPIATQTRRPAFSRVVVQPNPAATRLSAPKQPSATSPNRPVKAESPKRSCVRNLYFAASQKTVRYI